MSTSYTHDEAEVKRAVDKAVTTLGWFTLQILGCVVAAVALASIATLVSRHFFAGI